MMKKGVVIVSVASIGVLIIAGGVFVAMSLFGRFAGIEQEKLVSYRYSSGGGMRGGSYSKTVCEFDEDSALVTIKQCKWHGDDGTVKEYLIDKAILNELKAVFIKYRMKKWNNKKFTKMFIADGASYSYSFDFETDFVTFSSQYYPEKYSSKLKELDEILDKYLQNTALLPGLLIKDTLTENDYELPYDLDNEVIVLSVYSYYQNLICYRLANGTNEEIKAESVIRLYGDDERVPIYEKNYEHEMILHAHRLNEDSIEIDERLAPGKYRLEACGYETEFEIQ